MIICELDKAGAEWVIVAHLSGDENMLDVVRSGDSPHLRTGMLISRAPRELVLEEHKLIGQLTDPDEILELRTQHLPDLLSGDYYLPRSMSIRQAGKKDNHGLNYGMRYRRFALENEIPEPESKTLVELYHQGYPGIRGWHSTIQTKLRKDRTLVNCFGRKRKFLGPWGDELFDQAYSFLPQSSVYDVIRQGMYKTYYDPSPLFEQLQLLDEVHDSFKFQYPDDSTSALTEVMVRVALDYLNPELVYNSRHFKIGTTAKIGYNFGDLHDVELSEDLGVVETSIKRAIEDAKKAK